MLRRRALHTSFVFVMSTALAAGLVHCSGDDDGAGAGSSSGSADGGSTSSSGGSSSGNTSGSSSGGAGVDANKPPRCDPNKPFGPPVMVLENSFRIDQSARLSPDELTLYYAGYGHDGVNGQAELWVATRASIDVPFKNPAKVVELSSAESELYPTVTADGLTIYYSGMLPDAGYGTLKSTRASASAPWGAPTMLTGLDLSMVYVAPDGTRLYGVKALPGGPPSSSDLRYVELPYDGGLSQSIPRATTGGLQYWPVISADGLTLFYSYPRLNPYRWELGIAKRATTSEPFGATTKVTELDLDGGADEDPTWISPDTCTLYLRRVNGNIPGNNSGLLQATRGL